MREFMWNYRIIKKPNKAFVEGFEYGVHEVYYDKPKKPSGWATDSVKLGGFEDSKDLLGAVRLIARDLQSVPVLELKRNKLYEIPTPRQSSRKAKTTKGHVAKS